MEADIERYFNGPFLFRNRPAPVSGDLRPLWRVPIVLMLVRTCRQQHATHAQIHVVNWGLRSADAAQTLRGFLRGSVRPERAIVRFEPALDRTVALTHGFGLLNWDKRYWSLTVAGLRALEEVDSDDDLFAHEKRVLAGLPPVSQADIRRLLGRQGA